MGAPRAGLVACALWTAVLAAPASAAPKGPATPVITPSPRTFVAFAGQPASVRVFWSPVRGATRYRARWIEGGAETDVELPASDTVFEHAATQAGQHHVTIVAIDEQGVESLPAQVTVEVVRVDAIDAGGDVQGRRDTTAFAVGSRFSSPGLRCRLGIGAPDREVIATTPGATHLACGGDPGQPSVEVPVVIAPVTVMGYPAPVVRGTRTTIHITVASVAPLGDRLEVEAIGDLELGEIERSPGGLDVEVLGAADGAPEATLVVRGGPLELGRVQVTLTDPPPAVAPSYRTDWFALDLGAYVGALVAPTGRDTSLLLGEPLDPDDSVGSGPLAGIRLGLFPTRRVGLELETAIATPSYAGRLGVGAMLVSRAQVAARVAEDGRFGLRALVGGDLIALLTEAGTSRPGTVGGVHYGAAFTVETRRNVSVRFQALHVMTVARDAGYAHCLELGVGVVARLGRRDRWN